MVRYLLGLAFFIGLAACHDSPRRNPLDPDLTPAVELTAVADDTTGTVALSWTPYAGGASFRQYLVLRSIARSADAETLFAATSPESTRFVDRTRRPDTAYEYRVAAVNRAGLTAISPAVPVPAYAIQGVQLLAAAGDSLAGTMRLRWSRYAGAGFQAYEVQRQETGREPVTLPVRIAARDDTVLSDTTAGHGVDYLYAIVTRAAGRALASNGMVARLSLPAVAFTRADFDARTASAVLVWESYRGPRFAGYRLERTSPGLAWSQVTAGTNLGDTLYADAGLSGNTAYSYRVVVTTARGEEVVSADTSGSFHRLLATWPLDAVPSGGVRLYWEDDELQALLVDEAAIRLARYGPDGNLLGEQTLLAAPSPDLGSHGRFWSPRSVAMAKAETGIRLVTLNDSRYGSTSAVSFTSGGEPEWRPGWAAELPPFSTASDPDTILNWRISTGVHAGRAAVTRFDLSIDGARHMAGRDLLQPGRWSTITDGVIFGADRLYLTEAPGIETANAPSYVMGKYLGVWSRADLTVVGGCAWGALQLDISPPSARYKITACLYMASAPGEVPVLLVSQPFQVRDETIVSSEPVDPMPFPVVTGIPYQFHMAIDRTGCRLEVRHAIRWSRPGQSDWANLAVLDADTIYFAGAQPVRIQAEGGQADLPALPGPVGEARAWISATGGRSITRLGICLPEQHEVRWGSPYSSATGAFRWPFASTSTTVGSGVGDESPDLRYPLSFAGAPDGRVYVLDAGSGLVKVYQLNGAYLTCWGERGSGPGQFDFGSGQDAGNLSGSIAVDDQGCIYVADPGNRRIQKFAP